METETIKEITFSDESKFVQDNGKISLKYYSEDLLFALGFDTSFDAKYSVASSSPLLQNGVEVANFDAFGFSMHGNLKGEVIYDEQNFYGLLNEGRIKFWIKPGFNNAFGYQLFKNKTVIVSVADDYTINIVDGNNISDFSIHLNVGDDIDVIWNKLQIAVTGFGVNVYKKDGCLQVMSSTMGNKVSLQDALSGKSLINLMGGVFLSENPNAPTKDVEFFALDPKDGTNNNKISLTHKTDSHIQLKMYNYDGTLQIDQDLGLWSNEPTEWYAFELSFNENIAQFFINGKQNIVFSTGIDRRDPKTKLVLFGDSLDFHQMDELTIKNTYGNIKNFEPDKTPLYPYPQDKPYIDIEFGTGYKENQIKDILIQCSSNCFFSVKMGINWYYYYSGAWRSGDGTFSTTMDSDVLQAKFAELFFEETSELLLRCYFNSDGYTDAYLSNVSLILDSQSGERAIITGAVDLRFPVDLSLNNLITIATDQGAATVDLSISANDKTKATLSEIKQAVDAANVPGLYKATDDNRGHLVFQSITIGTKGSVSVSDSPVNNALPIVWGAQASLDAGVDADANSIGSIDFTEIYRFVRSRLGGPKVPVELDDSQIDDCLSEAMFHFNRWRNFKENIISISLNGNSTIGYELPAVIGGEENILEIIMTPRFPFSYYAGKDDLMSNLFVQQMFAGNGMGLTNAVSAGTIISNVADYSITLSAINDINMILGTVVRWEILNRRLFIYPHPPAGMQVTIKFKSTLTLTEIINNMQIKMLTLAIAKITLGTLRSTFGNQIPGGDGMLQLNGSELIQQGQVEKDAIIDDLKKSTNVYEFFFG